MTRETNWIPSWLPYLLISIFALALGLRLWGINFGLPFLYHSDEGAVIMPALNIIRTGDYKPIRLDYGSAYIYGLAALYIPFFLYGAWRGYFRTVADLPVYADYRQIGQYPFPGVFVLARCLTALLGSLTVLVVYRLGNRLAGWRAGLIAAAWLAVAPLHVLNSHFGSVDVPAALLITLAVARSLDVFERGDAGDYIWAGALVGLSASTKFTSGIALSALLVAHALRARAWSDLLNRRLMVGLAAAIGGFLLGTPYALDLPYFLNWLAVNLIFYGSTAGGLEAAGQPSSVLFYARELLISPFGVVAFLGIIGLAWLIRCDWRRGLVVSAFPIAYSALIAFQASAYPRWLVPLIPFLSLGAGVALDSMFVWLSRRRPGAMALAGTHLVAMVCLIGVLPFASSAQSDMLLAGRDVRTEAFDWFKSNISPEAKIAAEPTGPPLQGWSHNLYVTWDLIEHPPEWYVEQGFDYLALSEPRLLDANVTPQIEAAYRRLTDRWTLIKTFMGPMLGTDNIRIWVYEIAP